MMIWVYLQDSVRAKPHLRPQIRQGKYEENLCFLILLIFLGSV